MMAILSYKIETKKDKRNRKEQRWTRTQLIEFKSKSIRLRENVFSLTIQLMYEIDLNNRLKIELTDLDQSEHTRTYKSKVFVTQARECAIFITLNG